MKQFLVSIFAIALTFTASAKDDIIIKLQKGTNPFTFEKFNNVTLKPVAPSAGLYSVSANDSNRQIKAQSFTRAQGVELAQANHPVTLRKATKNIPDDLDFNKQWNLSFGDNAFGIDAMPAWDSFGTGGTDAAGNEIVIAIVDGGFDINHPDLASNLWVNKGEIPGNYKDDDGNGYVDDVHGWNVEDETGNILVDYHGTHVAGIAGAHGNNGLNGTGVNWNVKIMYVSAGWSLADTEITMNAYGYILEQKQRWLETGGAEGANVVAINSSFGIDAADCNSGQYPLWNAMFNELGKAGILSIAATANRNFDIDKMGDVPTGCDSPYLIAVSNSDISGTKVKDAGYGVTTIDLAAPGQDIYSTFPDEDFGLLGGTSMATPHVAGAVAYLHSAASVRFNNKYLSDKAPEAVLELKEILIKSVTKRTSMKNQSIAEGILNLNQAGQMIYNY